MSIASHHMLMSAVRGSSPTPPTPTYEYEILQNFIQGHSVGEPAQSGDPWITQVLSEEDYYTNWLAYTTENLVDTTVGATLIDSRKPLDFSKYNVSSGTPYGISTSNQDDEHCEVDFEVSSLYPITLETFAFGRSDEAYQGRTCYETMGSERILTLGSKGDAFNPKNNIYLDVNTTNNEITLGICGSLIPYDVQTLLTIECASDEDISTQNANGMDLGLWLPNWHHYAVTIDINNLYLFLDGKLKGTVALSTQCEFDVQRYNGSTFVTEHRSGTLKQMIDSTDSVIFIKGYNLNHETFDGAYAQLAVCNQCKWTSDFTPPTEAY